MLRIRLRILPARKYTFVLHLRQRGRGFAAGQKLFGRYTLKGILDRGGMGIMWWAIDEQAQRDFALKFFAQSLLNGGQYDIRHLQHWRLPRQRKHLVDNDPGSDRCVLQASFANRFLYSGGSRLIKDVPFLLLP